MYNRQAGGRGGFRQPQVYRSRDEWQRHDSDSDSDNKTVALLREEMEALKERLTAMESRQVQFEEKAKKKEKEDAAEIETLREKLEDQTYSFERLFESMHMFEAFFLELRPSAVPITIERQLDDARFSLADGFMKVFPSAFKSEELKNKLDRTGNTLQWVRFQSALSTHYWLHVSPSSNEEELYQLRSVFEHCNRGALLAIDNSALPKRAEKSLFPTPNIRLFERAFIADFDSDRRRPDGESSDNFFTRQLRFYIPVFVWAFNELKKVLLNDDAHLRSVRGMVELQLWHMKELLGTSESQPAPGPIPEEDAASHFALGTALELRKGEYWGRILGVVNGEVTTKGSGSASGLSEGLGKEAEQVLDTITEEVENAGGAEMTQGQSSKPESAGLPDVPAGRKRRTGGSGGGSEEDEARPAHKPWQGADPSKKSVPSASSSSQSDPSDLKHLTSALRELGDDKMVTMGLKNAKSALEGDMINLTAAFIRRRGHLNRFNSILKCLVILLDENLLKFAVHGSPVVLKVLKHVGHRKFKYEPDIDVALKHMQDLVDDDDDDANRSEIDIQTGSKKLSKLVNESGQYFDKQDVSVEQAIDEHLKGESSRNETTLTTEAGTTPQIVAKTDLYVLMSWLQGAHPVK